MLVLGIETSCDETGVALYDSGRGLLANTLFSQTAAHAPYGGIVPELASRDHIRKLLPLIRQTLDEAQVESDEISGIAYTAGPGLVGALIVGATLGRSLAWAWNIPGIPINHMEAHLLAPMLEPDPPPFPFVALLVSGGHTQLVAVEGIGQYQLLGESLDDAAGEAFDKTAKLLGLPYPGGPALAKLAEQGDPNHYRFPRPMTDRPGLDFSFSGLKTAVLHAIGGRSLDEAETAAIARSFQDAVIDTLILKCERALAATHYRSLVVAGGVGANNQLRQRLRAKAQETGFQVHYPRPDFCTDNGAMVAYAGYRHLALGATSSLAIKTQPRWSISQHSIS